MRRVLTVFIVAAFCLGVGLSPAQIRDERQPAKPETLEQLQAEALKYNPDVKVAEAKVRLAEAKLERVRVNLKAQIAVAHAEIEAARAGFEEGSQRYNRALNLRKSGAISAEDLGVAKLTMEKLRNELAVKEAQLQVLVGRPTAQKPSPPKQGNREKTP